MRAGVSLPLGMNIYHKYSDIDSTINWYIEVLHS